MKLLLTIFISIALNLNSFCQISEGGQPYSFSHQNITSINQTTIAAPSQRKIQSKITNDKSSYCVGVILPCYLNPSNSGTWISHLDGSRSWLLKINSPNAIGLTLSYKYFNIPQGGELFLYNENKTHTIGKFSSSRNIQNPITHTQIIEGETTIIEYHEPANSIGKLKLEIESVGYIFRGFEDYLSPFKNTNLISRADPCQVDVACSPENIGWNEQIDAVVHFSFPDQGFIYVCSSSLINNTDQDCKPYILTAWHCGEHTANQNLSGYTWYWNYQKTTCQPNSNSSNPSKGNETMINGTVKSSSGSGSLNNPPSGQQVAGSDFTLIELGTNIPTSYNPYYAGWDRGVTLKTSGVTIHHPSGSAKKISTYTSNLSSITYNGGAFNGHWEVYWSSTTNGHGVTEGGSSGAPLFDQNKRIVGQLSGGASFCTNPNNSDDYGKLYTSWSSNGSSSGAKLQPWLDPSGSNAITMDGTYAPCSGPLTCGATASSNNVNAGNSIDFSGSSSNSLNTWSWNFDVNGNGGVSPSTSNVQNPSGITFNSSGTYDVLLTVSSSGSTCSSSLTLTINSNTGILDNDETLSIFPNPNNGSFTIDFSNFNLINEVISIHDHLGRTVKTFHVGNSSELKNKIELNNFKSGIYFIKSKQINLINNKIIILDN